MSGTTSDDGPGDSESCARDEMFACVACTDTPSLFTTWDQVRVHTLEVHRVSLDSAARAIIRLPSTLFRYRCKICPVDEEQKPKLSEEKISSHLSQHSSFFSRSVSSYCEPVCRVCQAVLEDSEGRTVTKHYHKHHPAASFATPEAEMSRVRRDGGGDRNRNTPAISPVSRSSKPTVEMTEADLLNINWQQGKSLQDALKSLAKFLTSIDVVEVVEQEEGTDTVLFRIAEKKKFIKILKIYSKNETNSFDKLRSTTPRLALSPCARHCSRFGLLVNTRREGREKEPLQRLLTKYPGAHLEESSHATKRSLAIVWLSSKLEFFRVLTDSTLHLSFTPSLENFVDLKTPSEDKKVQKKKHDRREQAPSRDKRRKLR